MKDLQSFVGYFKQYLQDIEFISLQQNSNTRIYKKVLYVSVLDAISASIFPKEINRERFIKLISEFCDWPESRRVSFPHFRRLVHLLPESRFEVLHDYVKKTKFDPDSRIDKDPSFAEIAELCKESGIATNEKLFGRITIGDLKHSSLFWQLRNGLVHEFRKRGQGLEDEESSDPKVYPNGVVMPYYHSVNNCDDQGNIHLELVYPLGFFKRIAESALKNAETHFRKIDYNPYDSFRFGPFYLEDLNSP
ncbi:hypothetical protein KJZ99_11040 [bacterium]|nr:hypothetical protein [bacterium]